MSSRSWRAGKPGIFSVREMVLLAVFAAMMVAGQVALASIPNVEVVSLLVIACALIFGTRSLLAVYAFVAAEAMIYGFGLWVINYMYVWAILALVVILLRRVEGRFLWALISGLYGLFFGALCAIPYLFIGGIKMAFSYWAAGIIFDLIHAAGNFVTALILLPQLMKAASRLVPRAIDKSSGK